MNLARLEALVMGGDLGTDSLAFLLSCRGECAWLDYKQELPLEHDKHLCDFARDTLAIKNVGGGFIVVGVEDKTWHPRGLPKDLPYDAKLLRDKIRHATGIDLEVYIVHHRLQIEGGERCFAVIHIRSSKKRKKRRIPTLVGKDFCVGTTYGLRRGEIYVRRGDSTVRVSTEAELEELLDSLEALADESALESAGTVSPFAVEDGTYRLLEKGFDRFVGREALRRDVFRALQKDPRLWIINVHGPGGVGKSAIVNSVTYECYEKRQFEAILQLSGKETVLTTQGIRPCGRSLYSLDDLLDRIISMFQEPNPTELLAKQKLATDILCAWHTLLVLDNMETVTDGRILTFIQNLPPEARCKVLMTSRTRTGGWELPIPVCELGVDECEEFIRAKALDFRVVFPSDRQTLDRVVAVSGGLPLAIQWLIGRYKVTKQLDAVLQEARSPESPVLEFSFRNIWGMLSADARAILATATIFDAPPTLPQLAIATEWATERIERGLQELTEVTLTNKTFNQADGTFRYTALPITLSFAQHQFHTMGDFEVRIRQRVQRYNDQMTLQQAEVRRFGSTFERYGLVIDGEKRAAILCSRGQSEMFSGNTDAADTLFKQARDLAPQSAYVFAMSASYELARNRVGVALDHAERACRQANKRSGALAYTILARIHDVQRDKAARVSALENALNYDPDDAVIRHQYGVALSRIGRTKEAVAEFTRIIEKEKGVTPPRDTLLMALKTRIINYRRLGMISEANSDLALGLQILKANPLLGEQIRHFEELAEDETNGNEHA